MKTVPGSVRAALSLFASPLVLLLAGCSGSVGTFPSNGTTIKENGIDAAVRDASTGGQTVEAAEAAPPDGTDASLDTGADAADASMPAVEAAAPSACSGYVLCDDFESAAVGGPPAPALWPKMTPGDCSSNVGSVAIDDSQAHSGHHSVKVVGGPAYCDHVFFVNTSAFPAVGSDVYVRFFVRFAGASQATAPNAFAIGQMAHETFMRMSDSQAGGKHLRLGGWNEVLAWNRESDGVTLPLDVGSGSSNVQMESVIPQDGDWECVEAHLDQSAGTIETWVNEKAVTDLAEDGKPDSQATQAWQNQPWKPTFTDFGLGWESYDSETATLWFDDVVIDSHRIGCTARGMAMPMP